MIRIAYCPTMKPYADKISEKVNYIKMLPMQSAAQVLYMLATGQVEAVLIGRYAKMSEIDENTEFVKLQEGITLIYKFKNPINQTELKNIVVNTYLKEDKISSVKSMFGKIEFKNSLDECLDDKLETPVIIDWKDYRDEFELLIPIGEYGKTPQFRAPVIYYKNMDSDSLDTIKKFIK